MRETDPAIVDGQIETGIRAHNNSVHGFLNNFDGHFPGGYKVRLAEMAETLDEVHSAGERSSELHSERFMSETPREFIGSIDRAISTTCLDRSELEELRANLDDAHDQAVGVTEAHEAYCTFILPVYRQLRTEGYTHYDLVA
jgi:hypothetical protein